MFMNWNDCKVIFCLIFVNYMNLRAMVHIKCRGGNYPFSDIKRKIISDEQVPWSARCEQYSPPEYNSNVLINKPWADPLIEDAHFNPKWNKLDGNINRISHMGNYTISDKRPLNPEGRTGLKGRGVLGRWGPNHAADPIVTRWKRVNGVQQINNTTQLPILQFCAIQRRDCGQWALPGGMVDPGEHVNETLKREFLEEALNSLESSKEQVEKDAELISEFFKKGREIFRGYVDDPRNTDNSWMETVVYNFHDDDESTVGKIKLRAGDDAKNIQWMDIDKSLNLYASHSTFIHTLAKTLSAHW